MKPEAPNSPRPSKGNFSRSPSSVSGCDDQKDTSEPSTSTDGVTGSGQAESSALRLPTEPPASTDGVTGSGQAESSALELPVEPPASTDGVTGSGQAESSALELPFPKEGVTLQVLLEFAMPHRGKS